MLKNNIEMDIRMRCIEKSTTQTKIADRHIIVICE